MVMIPTAWNAGFGQKVAKATPAYVAPPAVSNFVDMGGVGAAIGQGLQAVGENLLNYGVAQWKEQNARIEKAQKEQTFSKASVDMLGLGDAVNQGVDAISRRTDFTPTEKMDAYKTLMDGVKSQYDSLIPKELSPHFDPMLMRMGYESRDALANTIEKQTNDSILADGMKSLAILERGSAANPSSRQTSKDAGAALIATLPVDETVKVQMTKAFNENLDRNEVDARLAAMDRSGYHVGLKKTLADLQAKGADGMYSEYPGITTEERTKAIAMAQTGIISDAKSRDAAFNLNAKNTVAAYKEKKLSGLPVSISEEARIYRSIKGSNYEADFLEAKQKGESMPYVLEQMAKDPFTYGAARLGITTHPINFTNADTIANSIAENLRIGARIQADTGMTYAPVASADMVKSLVDVIKKDPAGMGVDLIDGLARKIGERNVTGLAMQMAQVDPGIASIARYAAAGETLTAREVAKGQKLIETKAILLPSPDVLKEQFANLAGSALRMFPNGAAEAQDAFRAILASEALRAGIQGQDVELGLYAMSENTHAINPAYQAGHPNLLEIAFRKAVGNVIDFNGTKTLLPKGTTEDEFINLVRKNIDPSVLARMGGVSNRNGYHHFDSLETAASDIVNNGQFVAEDNGIYRVYLGGLPVINDNGMILRFKFK